MASGKTQYNPKAIEDMAIVSLSSWLRSVGRSKTWGWRLTKRGWLHPVNICGRPYLTAADLKQFYERAANGEFAAPPAGAAGEAAKARSATRNHNQDQN